MYESVRIQNFRGFEDLTVDGLTRVNLIVGKNGVGKTTLLEAIFLLLRAADIPVGLDTINLRRGFGEAFSRGGMDQGVLESLFWSFNMSSPIAIWATHGSVQDELRLQTSREGGGLRLRANWRLADGRSGGVEYLLDTNLWTTIALPTGDDDPRRVPSFLGTQRPDNRLAAEAELFSALVYKGKKEQVKRSLQVIASAIRDLELLQIGGAVGVYADVDLTKRIPLALLGEGTQRLLALVTALGDAPGSLTVDEIDTGLHYTILPDMWRVVSEAAREFDVQLFATTHSYECMTAAYEAFADHPEDFSMHRLERVNGDIVCKSFGHETLGNALEHRMEVR